MSSRHPSHPLHHAHPLRIFGISASITIALGIWMLFYGGISALWLFFVLALLVGSISGTYSSPCIAVPMLRIFFKLQRKYAH